ncbi:MAG: DNA-processing protein DprA [Flammeovirgaceae bacterium]|nr:DNA-processing protein DprA [Flammeovirgaceae bacterium]
MEVTENNLYEVALNFIPGIGNVNMKQIVSYCGSAEAVFKTPKGKLLKIPGVGPKTVEYLQDKNCFEIAEEELKKAEKFGASLLFYTNKKYPERLKNIPTAPALIYYKGNTLLNATKVISIVGTRKATPYGLGFIENMMKELKLFKDIIIISGLAYGIDICAHREALKNDIPTIGVMANGLDKIYPAVHKNTAIQMLENGGLITENKFGTLPDAPKFPERNRIIAGMSDLVIVVEAAASGGALITAEIANSYDIEVFAVPGDVNNSFSEGCNHLIKKHKAHLLTSIEDVKYMMNWETGEAAPKKINLQLTMDEANIVNWLAKEKTQIDMLSLKTQIPMSQLSALLLEMEFKGLVKALPGKRFTLA